MDTDELRLPDKVDLFIYGIRNNYSDNSDFYVLNKYLMMRLNVKCEDPVDCHKCSVK